MTIQYRYDIPTIQIQQLDDQVWPTIDFENIILVLRVFRKSKTNPIRFLQVQDSLLRARWRLTVGRGVLHVQYSTDPSAGIFFAVPTTTDYRSSGDPKNVMSAVNGIGATVLPYYYHYQCRFICRRWGGKVSWDEETFKARCRWSSGHRTIRDKATSPYWIRSFSSYTRASSADLWVADILISLACKYPSFLTVGRAGIVLRFY